MKLRPDTTPSGRTGRLIAGSSGARYKILRLQFVFPQLDRIYPTQPPAQLHPHSFLQFSIGNVVLY